MASQQQLPILTQSEQDNAKKAFEKYDEDHSGSIDIVSWPPVHSEALFFNMLTRRTFSQCPRTQWELRKVMQSMGKCPSEEELLQMIMEVDEGARCPLQLPLGGARSRTFLVGPQQLFRAPC